MKKPRILVVGIGCGYGGTETVVSRFVGALSDRYAFDTFSDVPLKQTEYSEGDNNIIRIPAKRKSPFSYAIQIRRFFKQHAHEYSALWFNANSFSNITPLKLAAKYGIQKRIVHFHNTEVLGNVINRFLTDVHRDSVNHLSTNRLACSIEAGRFAYGESEFSVVPNAFDLVSFGYSSENRFDVRKELAVSDGDFVIGTVGRLAEQKNQSLLIRIMPQILHKKPNAKLVIVGEGPLKDTLKKEALSLRVQDKVIFTGARTDISRILSAFDVFVFPSRFEGLGISLVEAQANGLPCVISNQIPSYAVVSDSVLIRSLSDDLSWVDAIQNLSRDKFKFNKKINEFDISSCAYTFSKYFNE